IVAADHQQIAAGMVRAAVARAPYAPALLEGDCLGDGRTQHLRIGERDVFGQRLAIWCERDCIAVYATNAAAPIASLHVVAPKVLPVATNNDFPSLLIPPGAQMPPPPQRASPMTVSSADRTE